MPDADVEVSQDANPRKYYERHQTLDQTQQLVKSIREDPKKYLVIRMKVF